MDLNDEQRAAVEFTGPYLLVVAAPGAGKTGILVHRVVKLIERGVRPDQLVLMTFTRKAAQEMRDRLEKLIGPDASRISAGTFHSFAFRLLKEQLNGAWKEFAVVEDPRRPIGKIVRELKLKLDPQDCASNIMLAQQRLLTPDVYREIVNGDLRRADIAKVYDAYQRWKWEQHKLDYGDFVPLALQLLEKPETLVLTRARCKHLLIDEFQDIGYDQFELMKRLVGANGHVTAVGDFDQSVYGFRGADPRFLDGFRQLYPRHHMITVTRNYRSTPEILRPALALIRHNTNRIDKPLMTRNQPGAPVEVTFCPDTDNEAKQVVQQIARDASGKWGDYAILYRCVTPDTPILTSSLRYIPAGELAEGDELVAFQDKAAAASSVFRPAIVTTKRTDVRPCVRVETEFATVIVTRDHPFLVTRKYGPKRAYGPWYWKNAEDLVPGQDEIISLGPPWTPRRDFEAGWLAGILDGEGSVLAGRGTRQFCKVSLSQNNGKGALIHERARRILVAAGYDCRTYQAQPRMGVTRVLGKFSDNMRLLGEFRPERLVAIKPWIGESLRNLRKARVASVTSAGDREIVVLATSEGTLITAGLFSHNCNAQSLAIESALFEAEIPYSTVGKPFFELSEVKLLLAYLRLVRNTMDDAALKMVLNVPPRYLGPEFQNGLQTAATEGETHLYQALDFYRPPRHFQSQKAMEFKQLIENLRYLSRTRSPAQLLREVRGPGGFDPWLTAESDDEPDNERARNIDELCRVAERWTTTGEFLQHVMAVTKASKGKGNRVHMLTLHRSKGLEFPHVWLIGMTDGVLPHEKATWAPGGEEEERRLCYVGMTRAMKSLHLSVPERVWSKTSTASRFLYEAGLLVH
jgi:superfamily I DNA/RNA helicase